MQDIQGKTSVPRDSEARPGTNGLSRDSVISLQKSLVKLLLLVLGVSGALLLIHASPAGDALSNISRWRAWMIQWGAWGPLLFAFAAAVLVAGGFPRLWMSAMAGALLGVGLGLPIAWLAATAGAYVNFLFVRWGAGGAAGRVLRRAPRLQAAVSHPTVMSVILVRQLPVWGLAQNSALALTRIKHGTYLVGTLCGILPSTLIMTLVGGGIGEASPATALRPMAWAMAVMAILGGGVWRWRKSYMNADAVS